MKELVIKNMMGVEYYVDEDTDNRWSVSEYTKEKAEELAQTMINSFECTDCANCENCNHCSFCENCKDCQDCIRTNNSIHCFRCVGKDNLFREVYWGLEHTSYNS